MLTIDISTWLWTFVIGFSLIWCGWTIRGNKEEKLAAKVLHAFTQDMVGFGILNQKELERYLKIKYSK